MVKVVAIIIKNKDFAYFFIKNIAFNFNLDKKTQIHY